MSVNDVPIVPFVIGVARCGVTFGKNTHQFTYLFFVLYVLYTKKLCPLEPEEQLLARILSYRPWTAIQAGKVFFEYRFVLYVGR